VTRSEKNDGDEESKTVSPLHLTEHLIAFFTPHIEGVIKKEYFYIMNASGNSGEAQVQVRTMPVIFRTRCQVFSYMAYQILLILMFLQSCILLKHYFTAIILHLNCSLPLYLAVLTCIRPLATLVSPHCTP
jgi:hypothetical protein